MEKKTPDQVFSDKQAAMSNEDLINLTSEGLHKLCITGGRSLTMCVPPMVTDFDMLVSELLNRFKASQFKPQWTKCSDRFPEEGGRYLCYVIEQNDLGLSGFVWNCAWCPSEKIWSDKTISMYVTHWQPLPEKPND